jgi:uncharacterized protein YecE (DUF72 family)
VNVLGDRLAVLLVQLPPKLEFDERTARAFFADLHNQSNALLACEPRNPSWFTTEAQEMLVEQRVARVAADPAVCEPAARPGGWSRLCYWRLHGSPVVYRSSYSDRTDEYADRLTRLDAPETETWCIFDNTASSAATGDALALKDALRRRA